MNQLDIQKEAVLDELKQMELEMNQKEKEYATIEQSDLTHLMAAADEATLLEIEGYDLSDMIINVPESKQIKIKNCKCANTVLLSGSPIIIGSNTNLTQSTIISDIELGEKGSPVQNINLRGTRIQGCITAKDKIDHLSMNFANLNCKGEGATYISFEGAVDAIDLSNMDTDKRYSIYFEDSANRAFLDRGYLEGPVVFKGKANIVSFYNSKIKSINFQDSTSTIDLDYARISESLNFGGTNHPSTHNAIQGWCCKIRNLNLENASNVDFQLSRISKIGLSEKLQNLNFSNSVLGVDNSGNRLSKPNDLMTGGTTALIIGPGASVDHLNLQGAKIEADAIFLSLITNSNFEEVQFNGRILSNNSLIPELYGKTTPYEKALKSNFRKEVFNQAQEKQKSTILWTEKKVAHAAIATKKGGDEH